MQQSHERRSPIPPYDSPEYRAGAGVNINASGYNQRNDRYIRSTLDDGGRPLPRQQPNRGQGPSYSESMLVQPSTTRPPSAYSEASTLPYLQSDPPPPLPSTASGRPQSSPFPRFVPPPLMPQPSSVPNTPGSLYPPSVDYHLQALAVVGAHPSTTPKQELPQPAFFPAMMRPQNSMPARASMPVEAVMARYGQALPDEGHHAVPNLPPQAAPNFPPQAAPMLPRTESSPMPPRPGSGHKKLSRQHTRRTQSDIPQSPSQPPPQAGPPSSHQPVVEEKKRSGSLLRKLTKKRPASMPPNMKGKVDPNTNTRPMEQQPRMEVLPDVLFHVRATQDYEMQSYEELSYSNGAIIAVKSAPESGRWIGYVVDSTGPRQDEGIFYRTFVSLMQRVDSSRARGDILFLVEAVYSYRAVREDEFDFSAGDTIAVYSTPQGPFWIGVNERSLSSPRTKFFPWKLVAPK